MSLDILVVDTGTELGTAIRSVLWAAAPRVKVLNAPEQLGEVLRTNQIDLVVAALDVAPRGGVEVLEVARALRPDAVRILVVDDDAPGEALSSAGVQYEVIQPCGLLTRTWLSGLVHSHRSSGESGDRQNATHAAFREHIAHSGR